ncbi:26087_t:CDS:2, partial [Racocetra persica]
FMLAATYHLPYGRSGDDYVTDLIDENLVKREAKALRHSLDHLVEHRNIQVTCLLSGWEVTSLSNARTDFVTSKVVTQHYNWKGIRLATRILDMKNSGIIIDAFIAKIMKRDKFI